MNFTEAVTTCFNKYATFDGTASRSEYWWFALFNALGNVVLSMLNEWLGLLFVLVLFVPSIAVACRRLHDTDRSGWWQLIAIVPVIGWIVMLVFLVQESRPNRYGAPAGAVA